MSLPSSPDAEPLGRCERHADEPTMHPCGACAEARKANANWHAARRRNTALTAAQDARERRRARAAEQAAASGVDHHSWAEKCRAVLRGEPVPLGDAEVDPW